MLNRRRVLLGGTAFAAAATIASVPLALPAHAKNSQVDNEVIAWLKANALPLATAEPGSGYRDLEPLRAVIGDARIVSLGEATHGTREFFQLKHRLIEYCVSQLGFTVIGFEAAYGETLAVNDYVLHGKGNAADVTAGMGFWTWNTEEVVALVEWVRAWNRTHERKVKFYGFDMQSGAAATRHIRDYLRRVAPDLAAESERILAPVASYEAIEKFHRLPAPERDRVFDQIKTVLDAFAVQRASWVGQTGEVDWHLARQSAIVVGQFAQFAVLFGEDKFAELFSFRDRCMADNLHALLDIEGPAAKALLWAHNGHVQQLGLYDMTTMGSLLHAEFGADYLAVGFAFNQGSFQAVDAKGTLRDHTVGPAPEDFLDGALAATGIPLFALDLVHMPPDGPVARWMADMPPQRMIGAVFESEQEHQYALLQNPRDAFDMLLFVETTTAARGMKRPTAVTVARAAAPRMARGVALPVPVPAQLRW